MAAMMMPSLSTAECWIKKSGQDSKRARPNINSAAFAIYICCSFFWRASCLQSDCLQGQAAIDRISRSPEGLCSVTQLSSRISQDTDLQTPGDNAYADEQEAELHENVNSENLDRKHSSGLKDGLCSGIKKDPLDICGVGLLQGRRPTQEDRAICLSHFCLSRSETDNISVGLYAVFDGHGGQEASTFAAEVFHKHFTNHFTQILERNEIKSKNSEKTPHDATWMSQGIWFPGSSVQQEGLYAGDLEASVIRDFEDRNKLLQSETPEEGGSHRIDKSMRNSDMGSSKEQSKNGYSTLTEKSAGEDEREHGELFPAKWRLAQEVLEDSATIRQILEESLSTSIRTIDTMFSMEATQLGLLSGTTACIVIQVEEDLLVANLGDSKAFICEPAGEETCKLKPSRRRRKKRQAPKGECMARLKARELTRDHNANRRDERQRIEEAGGFVTTDGDVSRVNGKLAVSRSIGDVHLKRFGVIADPEFTGWLKIPKGPSFLTIASDGVFEKLSTQGVCEVLQCIRDKEDVYTVLGVEDSRGSAPIAMLPSEVTHSDQDQFHTRDGCPVSVSDGICASLEKDFGNFSTAVMQSQGKVKEHTNAGSAEELPALGPESLVQSMAQAVAETAVELGTMDNVATIVLLLRPLPPRLPDPNPLLYETTDDSPGSTSHKQTGVRLLSPAFADHEWSDENTVEGLPDEASVVKPAPEADSMPSKGSTSRTWSKSVTENESSVVMMHHWETTYCYELIETLPRHAIVPLTRIMEGETPHKDDEAGHSDAFLATDVLYKYPGESPVGAGASLEVYQEHLVCTQHTCDEETKQLCRRPDGLSHFLALIGSVPLDSQTLLPDTDILAGLPDRPVFVPSSIRYHRYMLKKNFARGAFGEVWLAVRRTRSIPEGSDLNEFSNNSCSGEENKFDSQQKKGKNSVEHGKTTYVLKRILVERGNHVYLSGLREKYFGEIFLNASIARVRATKFAASFSCVSSNPFSSSGFGFCPWRLNNSRNFMRQNSRARRTENLRGADVSDLGSSISDEGVDHIVRYVESFEVLGPRELWLVFRNEGKSLSSLLYSSERAEVEPDLEGADGFFTVVQPSPWWHWLKSTSAGRKEMRSLLRQLLLAVRACHSRNITHRDIKPENMIVSWKGSQTTGSSKAEYPARLKMRLIDFGSALDPFTVKNMYGLAGPSRLEQTNEYAPPEALLGKHWLYFHSGQAHVYDMWSVGVVMLELVLGTPHVFQISSRTRALLDRRLQGWDQSARETAYMLRAFLEMCILLPGLPMQHQFHHRVNVDSAGEQRLASWECTEQAFLEQMKQRDILGIGMPDKWALRLVRRLLQWYPEDRISAEEALKHPYFHPKLQVD